jgi:hypothetical protein
MLNEPPEITGVCTLNEPPEITEGKYTVELVEVEVKPAYLTQLPVGGEH